MNKALNVTSISLENLETTNIRYSFSKSISLTSCLVVGINIDPFKFFKDVLKSRQNPDSSDRSSSEFTKRFQKEELYPDW